MRGSGATGDGVWVVTPYYERDGITLYHGSCDDILPLLEPGSVDLVFTSPPYNLGGASNSSLKASRPRKHSRWGYPTAPLSDGYGVHADDLPWPEYVAWQQSVLTECWRLLSETGAIYYNHKPVIRDKELRLPLECNPGLPLRQIITWDRSSGFNFSLTHYCPVSEWILVLAKREWGLKDWHASKATDVWRIDFEQGTPHPAPFPPALPGKAIETTGARRVLDPFSGWGTTLLAAKLAGVQAIGIESEERFCAMAARRLSQGTLPLFGVEAAS